MLQQQPALNRFFSDAVATAAWLMCRDSTNRQHSTPGLAIVAAVGAAAERGGAAWDSVKSLLPQVHHCLCMLLPGLHARLQIGACQHDWFNHTNGTACFQMQAHSSCSFTDRVVEHLLCVQDKRIIADAVLAAGATALLYSVYS